MGIGLPNPEEELRLLEEKANATYGVYKEKLETKEKLLAESAQIEEEKKALLKQIEKEQGNVSQYHERQAKISSQKAELEQESVAIKKDIGDIEMVIQKLEQEKTNRDHTIKTLNDEIANQDEIINKINKEKKHISENGAKSAEDLQVSSEKVDHLMKVKSKLESTLDELEASHEKEKRARGNAEKERRKIEGELKICQETVAELERSKKELEAAIMRKDNEIS